jgi:hypothetical protein
MATEDDLTTLKLRVVYEANQAIGTAIADIRRLKEETGGLSKENEKTLQTLEYQKTLLDGAGSGLDHYTELLHEEAQAQRAIRRAIEESTTAQTASSTSYKALRAEAQQLESQLKALRNSFKAGEIGSIEFQQQSEGLTSQLQTKNAVLSKANASTASFGRGLLQTSYAVQDFTSQLGTRGLVGALGAVQNNIPVILTGLGLGAGLAGVVSIVSVGLGMALPLLDKFSEGQTKAAEATKKHAEAAAKLKEGLTSEQDEIKAKVDAYTKDHGKTVTQAVEAAYSAEYRNSNVSDKDLAASLATLPVVVGETANEQVERGRAAARQSRAQADANRLLATLDVDPASRQEAARLARTHAGFPAGFTDAMEHPEDFKTQKEQDKLAKQLTEQGRDIERKMFEERDKQRDEEQKKKDKLSDDLTRQGLDLQEKTFKERDEAAEKEKREKAADTKKFGAARYAMEKQAEHEQEAAETRAERDARKAAHDADPSVANRRAIQSEQSQALGLVQDNTQGFSPDVQRQIAHHLQGNHQAGLDMAATFQQALAYAIQQTRQDMARGIQSGLRRQQQTSQSFYAP